MGGDLIWWVGAIHLAIYAAIGTAILLAAGIIKAHQYMRLVGVIILWHVARERWRRRSTDGLTDSEWQRGEPRP